MFPVVETRLEDVMGFVRAVPGGRHRISAEADADEGKAQHLHGTGGHLVDDCAASAAATNPGWRRGSADVRCGRPAAERLRASQAETDLAEDRRLQPRQKEAAPVIMQASAGRTAHSVARNSPPRSQPLRVYSGRFCAGTGSQSGAVQNISAGAKPARTGALASAADGGGA